ncbi:MAG: hypothetical protein RL220_512 [Bacteroidota bacterium]
MSRLESILVHKGHTGPVYSLCEGRTPGTVFSAGSDGFVVEWDLLKGQTGCVVRLGEPVYSVMYDASSGRLFAGAASGRIHIIDVGNLREERCIELHRQGVFDIRLSADRTRLITAGGDGKIFVWDDPDMTLNHAIKPDGNKCRQVIFKDEKTLLVCTSLGNIHEISLDPVRINHCWQAHQGGVYSLLWYSHRSLLFSGGKDAHIRVWKEQTEVLSIPAHNYAVYALEVSPDGQWIASASRDKTVKLWDSSTMQFIFRGDMALGGHNRSVNDLIWVGEMIASCGDDGKIVSWSVRKGDAVTGV